VSNLDLTTADVPTSWMRGIIDRKKSKFKEHEKGIRVKNQPQQYHQKEHSKHYDKIHYFQKTLIHVVLWKYQNYLPKRTNFLDLGLHYAFQKLMNAANTYKNL